MSLVWGGLPASAVTSASFEVPEVAVQCCGAVIVCRLLEPAHSVSKVRFIRSPFPQFWSDAASPTDSS